MKEKIHRKIKQNRAFTMMEMLIVVAMVVILSCISILSISNLALALKMSELDNHAKTVFLEAQNQLAAVEVAGGLPNLYDEMQDDYSLRFLKTEGDKPSDFDENRLPEENKQDWMNLCYVMKVDTVTQRNLILTQSSVYQLDGNYIIEFNPQTGDVYGVFYWTNNSIVNYADVIDAVGNRSLADRTDAEIGYYGGQMETTEPTNVSLGLNADIVNEEELFIKISLEKSSRLFRYYNKGALNLTCIVTDESGNQWIASTDADYEGVNEVLNINDAKLTLNGLEFYVLLDSLETGYGIMDRTSLVPGEDISVKVRAEFKQGAYYSFEVDEDNVANSIFARKEQGSGVFILEVNTVRHLLRLNDYIHNADDGNSIEILQTNDIDYTNKNFAWKNGKYVGKGTVNPFTLSETPLHYNSVTPIKNDTLFVNGGGTDITIINGGDNGGYEIKNFKIKSTTENAGLFAIAENVHFKNLRIEDITVDANGCKNVGALVGSIKAGSVENCGVYLSTYSIEEDGSKYYYAQQVNEDEIYPNDMIKRYDTYKVVGEENVGGLFGKANHVAFIKDSFAAIKVEGEIDCGGFIGYATTITSGSDADGNQERGIWNCYSSGSVVGKTMNTGGFIGYASNVGVTDAYSTSNIYGNDVFAGFTGFSNNCVYQNCKVYGEILNLSGTAAGLDSCRVNGFSLTEIATNNEYIDCGFLKQTSYNATDKLNTLVPAYSYAEFIASSENKVSIGSSYPYNAALLYKVFPFKKAMDSHYGDWPVQYTMNTSIVYYEKYKNFDGTDTYGFYCESRLTSKEDTDEANKYIWVLDTLQNRECVEDGYALLSAYNLEKFKYEIYVGSDDSLDYANTLQVGYTGDESANSAISLIQQSSLEFSAYTTQMEDYSEVEPEDTYIVTGMYLYQLPYELQNTDRYQVDSFYDELVVYAGYARGNADEGTSTPVIGGKTKEEGSLTFYYCPHFARTAMNPGVGTIDISNPKRVYVRSARQLNNLGRFPYYWNDKGGPAKMTFVQETDINFGTYTKNYCGRSGYDLMDTDAKVQFYDEIVSVANSPIGEALGQDTYEQFRNDYDGQTYKIIDYCVDSDMQFTGLFGTVKGGTLKNIIMTVSEEGKGKISSSFLHDGRSFDINRVGIGALVGLCYDDGGKGDEEGKKSDDSYFIENCVAVGYEVMYHQYAGNQSNPMPTGIAIGGLIGYSTTDIRNCAASNDIYFVPHCNFDGDRAVLIGGLAGSFWDAYMDNAYSGGKIDILFEKPETDSQYKISNAIVGGLCPGYLNTGEDGYDTQSAVYSNVYAYTDIANHVWNLDDFKYVIPSAGRLQIVDSGSVQPTEDMSSPGGYVSAYLKECYQDDLDNIAGDEDVMQYFARKNNRYGLIQYSKTCDGLSYDEIARLGRKDVYYNAGALFNDYDDIKYRLSDLRGKGLDDLYVRAEFSYPFDVDLVGEDYPFPEFIYRYKKDANGNILMDTNGKPKKEYVHYGDWPLKTSDDEDDGEGYVFSEGIVNDTILNNPPLDNQHNDKRFSFYGGIFYYEIYEDNTLGMYATGTVYAENSSQKGLIQTLSASKAVAKRGVGVFHYGETYSVSNGSYAVSREGGDAWDLKTEVTNNIAVPFTTFANEELVIKNSDLYPGYKFYSAYEFSTQGTLREILYELGYEEETYSAILGTAGGPAHQSKHEITIEELDNSRK